MSRIVVVGAGVGGLAAAARLAAVGHRVTVCEQAPVVGGKLGVLELDGHRFDTGPSLLTMPHVLAETFAATGAALCDVLELVEVEPIARYRFADGTWLDAPRSDDEFARELDATLGPPSGDEWRRLAARAAAIYAAVEGPFLERPLGLAGMLRLSPRWRALAAIAPWWTLRDLGRAHLSDPRLRTLLERYATYTGSDPRRAPAALASVVHAERSVGAWYVRGGLRRIADALLARCRELGVEVRTAAEVDRILVGRGRVTGVRLAGGTALDADIVVANAEAAHLYRDLLPGPAGRAGRRVLRRVEPSLSGFALMLGLTGRTPGLAHHTVLFPADYDAEFDDLFGPRPRPVADPTLYLAVPDDPAVAPAGDESWFVLANAPRQGQVDWTAPGLADAYGDHLLRLLADRGFDVRSRVKVRATRSPADLAVATRAVGGAIYGTSSNGARAAFLRPPNASAVPGLYLVGGSSHPGGGLPLVLLSAAIVAAEIGPAP